MERSYFAVINVTDRGIVVSSDIREDVMSDHTTAGSDVCVSRNQPHHGTFPTNNHNTKEDDTDLETVYHHGSSRYVLKMEDDILDSQGDLHVSLTRGRIQTEPHDVMIDDEEIEISNQDVKQEVDLDCHTAQTQKGKRRSHDNDALASEDVHQSDEQRNKRRTRAKARKCTQSIATTPGAFTDCQLEEEKFACHICGMEFPNKHRLKMHVVTHDPENQFPCHICGKRIKGRNNLKEHIKRIHLNKRDYSCNICGNTFKWRQSYTAHMKVHENEQKYECHVCNKKFNTPQSKRIHLKVHNEERKYQCFQCPMAFKSAQKLDRHSVIHSDERKYKCDLCDSRFKTAESLKGHINRIHTEKEDKEYRCDQCGKKFRVMVSLKTHIRKHDKSVWTSCDECGKSFPTNGQLKSHMLTHTGEQNHKCDKCPGKFSLRSNLVRHLRFVHKPILD